ncbi:MAG: uracil phosphoribosyltransferase [Paracoccaceae bacterium]
MTTRTIETPLKEIGAILAGKKMALVSILRAGNGLLDWGGADPLGPGQLRRALPQRRTLEPVQYYFKVPPDISDRMVIVIGHCSPPATARSRRWIS